MPSRISSSSPAPHKPAHLLYPIVTSVEFRTKNRKHQITAGVGRTIAMSARQVSLQSETRLPVGELLELEVAWPVRLEDRVPLKLQILGRTVHASGPRTIVQILRYEFRTMASGTGANPRALPSSAPRRPRYAVSASASAGALPVQDSHPRSRFQS